MAFQHARFQNSPRSYGMMGCGCGCACGGGCGGRCGCGCRCPYCGGYGATGGCASCGSYGAAGGSVLGVWAVPAWAFSDKKYGTCPGWAKNYEEWKTVVAEFKKLPKKLGLYSGPEADRLGNRARELERAGEAAWEQCKAQKGLIDTAAFQTEEASDNTIIYAIAGLGAVAALAGTVIFIRRRRAAAAAASTVKV
jgi:LPXTG-motif cell wall-anchored protein